MKEKKITHIFIASAFTLTIPILGYLNIGLIPAIIFLVGFLGGFITWLLSPMKASWRTIKVPYLLTIFLLILHRIDEEISGFFEELEKITGVPYPDELTLTGALILLLSVVWIISPPLLRKGHPLGYYGAWSFFFAMGVSELAHFIFPFFTPGPYRYFPGMISVGFLAPASWGGIYRLSQRY